MIKPASYWALHKTADPNLLGRVGVSLAGRSEELDPPLNPAEKALVDVIRQDSEWMDERVDTMREKARERKAAFRARMSPNVPGTMRDNEMSQGQDGTPQCPAPSVRPSVPPSVRPSVRPVPKGTDNNKRDTACADLARPISGFPLKKIEEETRALCQRGGKPYDPGFAEWFWKTMEAAGWRMSDGRGIHGRNLVPVMVRWYDRREEYGYKPGESGPSETGTELGKSILAEMKAKEAAMKEAR